MKELLNKKRGIDVGVIKVSQQCSVVMANNLASKRKDLGPFTISCTIRVYMFNKELCDWGKYKIDAPCYFKEVGNRRS